MQNTSPKAQAWHRMRAFLKAGGKVRIPKELTVSPVRRGRMNAGAGGRAIEKRKN